MAQFAAGGVFADAQLDRRDQGGERRQERAEDRRRAAAHRGFRAGQDRRVLERARDVDRRGDRAHRRVLALGADAVVDRLGLQVDRAVAVDVVGLGVDHHHLGVEHARFERQVHHHAAQRAARRQAEGVDHRVAELQAGQAHQQRAQVAAGHDQDEFAVAVAEEGRHRVAGGGDARLAADRAFALEHLGRIHDPRQRQVAEVDVGAHPDPLVRHRLQVDVGDDPPVADAEGEGLQGDPPVLDREVRADGIEGHVLALDLRAAIGEVHVGGAHLRHVDRLVGEELRLRLRRLELLLLLFGLLHAGVARLRTDEAAQVFEVDVARGKVGGHVRALLAGIHRDGALEIAVADLTLEVLEADLAVGIGEVAGHLVGRRGGDRHAGERHQGRHVGPGERQLHVDALEMQGVLHRACQGHLGRAVGEAEVDGIGLVLLLQRQHRAAHQASGDRLPGVAPLGVHDDLRLAGLLGGAGGDVEVEVGLELGDQHLGVAVGDGEVTDFRRLGVGVGRRVGGREGVIVAPVVGRGDVHLGAFDGDLRQADDVAAEIGHDVDIDAQAPDPGEGRVFRSREAFGIRHDDVAQGHPRHPPEVHVERPDAHRSPKGGAGARLDQRNEPRPRPKRRHQHRQGSESADDLQPCGCPASGHDLAFPAVGFLKIVNPHGVALVPPPRPAELPKPGTCGRSYRLVWQRS